MNPHGVAGNIFQSNSDQSANSFRDPLNISHLYPGWGTNPNYQTPAHDAPYRPAYQGPNPYAAYQKPTFMGGISQLYNPFYTDPYWGNPVDSSSQAFNAVGTRPMDAAATIGQRFIAPAVAYGVTQAVFRGVGSNIGRGLAGGLASGLGAGAGTAGMIGGAGALFGSVAIPFAIGTGVMMAAEKGVFQPYIRSRQMSEIVQDSFSGVTFGGGGNPISGRGLSGSQSAGVGSGIDRMGMMDMTFSANQFGGIASMGMRAGLFDNVNSGGGILERVSSIASQIKMIVAISKDPNIQNAIEELGKLKSGGAGIAGGFGSAAMGAYGSIGMAASAAGTSVQRIMNTVGQQGQYMYQMNGITPYLGQVSAANAFSGFASASRMGLLSTAQMSRMGGTEGATQSALAAQISASSTMFNRMGLANQFMGAGRTNGVVGTVSAFGAMASRDPLSTAGSMGLYGNAMVSSQMGGPDGLKSLENQAIQILETTGRKAGPGGHDPGAIYQVMAGMGVPPDQIQAYFSLRASQTSPDLVAQNIRAFRAQGKELGMQTINQNMMWGGPLGSRISDVVKGTKRGFATAADALAYPFTGGAGTMSDMAAKAYEKFIYGSTQSEDLVTSGGGLGLDMGKVRAGIASGMGGRDAAGKSSMRRAMASQENKILAAIDRAARDGGEGADIARKLLAVGFDSEEGKELFTQFLASQTDPELRAAHAGLSKSIGVYTRSANAARGNTTAIAGATGRLSSSELKIMDQAAEVHLSGGMMTTTLEKTLNDPRYKDLKKTLSGLGVDAQASAISALARGRVRAAGWNVSGNSTDSEINDLLTSVLSSDKAIKAAQEQSSSGVNYKEFREATSSIERGSNTFLEAVKIFAKTQGVSIDSGPNLFQRTIYGETQKSVGK